MSVLQDAKTVVRAFLDNLDAVPLGAATAQVCKTALIPDHSYRGVHPFNTVEGSGALADIVWSPLKSAIGTYQRRLDIFFAGHHHCASGCELRVVAMGHLLGDFTKPWLGIPPTGKAVHVPFVSFYRINDGEIAETVEFFDILAVMDQAGCNPCAEAQTAAQIMSPGPHTHDGLIFDDADPAETRKTFDLANTMLTELAETMTSPDDHMRRFWRSDMNWFGPTGIGACYGFDGYRRGHTGPFEERLEFVDYIPEEFAAAEGDFAAFLWRPGLRMRNLGGYMGLTVSDVAAEMRIVDLYRRDGDKLAENWIFIDMLHFAKDQGVDFLDQLQKGN